MMEVKYQVFDTPLEAKVSAVNLCHAYANELRPILVEACRPFVGQKVIKVDDTFTAAFKKVIDALDLPNKTVHVHRSSSRYNLVWVVNVSQGARTSGDHNISHRHEIALYIGTMEGQTLKSVEELAPLQKTDFTVERIKELRAIHKRAKEAASAAESALWPFGEYDR